MPPIKAAVSFKKGKKVKVKRSVSVDIKTALVAVKELNLIHLSQTNAWQPRVVIEDCAVPSYFSGSFIANKDHMIPRDASSIISSVGSSPTLVGEDIGVSEKRSRRDLWPDDRRRSSTVVSTISHSEVSPRYMEKQFNVHPHPNPINSRMISHTAAAPGSRMRGTEGLDKETGGPTAFESDRSETSSVYKYRFTSAFSSQSEHPRGSRTLKECMSPTPGFGPVHPPRPTYGLLNRSNDGAANDGKGNNGTFNLNVAKDKSQEEVINEVPSCGCRKWIMEEREKLRLRNEKMEEEMKFKTWWAAEKIFFRRQQLNKLEKQRQQEIEEKIKMGNSIKEKNAQLDMIIENNRRLRKWLDEVEKRIDKAERLQREPNANEK